MSYDDLPLQVVKDLWLVRFGYRQVLLKEIIEAAKPGADWHTAMGRLANAGVLERRVPRFKGNTYLSAYRLKKDARGPASST